MVLSHSIPNGFPFASIVQLDYFKSAPELESRTSSFQEVRVFGCFVFGCFKDL